MSDLKLFRTSPSGVVELAGHSVQMEKSLQALFEANLESLLGIRFLSSEHSTGQVHGGRIDTLGIDEDGCPVIIEYKRAVNENVINQGLFYLDWLMDHKKDFQWLVLEKIGPDASKAVDWSTPRLICIAGDFTRYDEHAVKQINRNIELLRYRRFGDEFLIIELVHAPKVTKYQPATAVSTEGAPTPPPKAGANSGLSQEIQYRIANASPATRDVYEAARDFIVGLGDDVQVKELQNYIAFKRIKNFACVEVYPQSQTVKVFLKVNPDTVELENGFTRDVRKIGHFGTGDLEVTLKTMDDIGRAQPLIQRSYEGS